MNWAALALVTPGTWQRVKTEGTMRGCLLTVGPPPHCLTRPGQGARGLVPRETQPVRGKGPAEAESWAACKTAQPLQPSVCVPRAASLTMRDSDDQETCKEKHEQKWGNKRGRNKTRICRTPCRAFKKTKF